MTFVFKAAVVGAGTMGGEIAQQIAAAGIPVVLKDVDQKFVDVGLQKAREVTAGRLARQVEKGRVTQEDADAQVDAVLGLIHGTTSCEGVVAQNVAPMGPFFLIDLLGLDTVFHVAEYLQESYGDRFYVHEGMRRLVGEGKLGAKTGGSGFYENGEPQIAGDADADGAEL